MAKATVDRPAGSDDASEPRRLTPQGIERKQQLLEAAPGAGDVQDRRRRRQVTQRRRVAQ